MIAVTHTWCPFEVGFNAADCLSRWAIGRTLLTSDVALVLYERSVRSRSIINEAAHGPHSTGDRRVFVATKKPTGSKRRNQTKPKNIAAIEPTVAEPNPSEKHSHETLPAPGGDSQVAPKSQSFDAPEEAQWHRMISIAAYYRAEKRDFADGHALEDWLTAEAQIKSLMGS